LIAASIAASALLVDAYVGRGNAAHPTPSIESSALDAGAGIKPASTQVNPATAALKATEDTARATWFLVYGTLALVGVGVYVGRKQAALMDRQATTMERQARIAERQLDIAAEAIGVQRAAANLERPWVMAKLSDINVGDAVRKNESVMSVEVSLINYGRSPGWVVESACRFELMDAPLPPDPPYGDVHEWDRLPIPPGQSVVLARSARALTPEMRTDFMHWWDDRRCLVVFGLVRYRDGLSGDTHETRFCWTWFNRHQPNGPKAWRGAR